MKTLYDTQNFTQQNLPGRNLLKKGVEKSARDSAPDLVHRWVQNGGGNQKRSLELRNNGHTYSLGKHTTVFQRYLPSYKVPGLTTQGPKVTSRLILECLEELDTLAEQSRIRLVQVPIQANKNTNKLVRRGSATTYAGPDPTLGVPKNTVRGAIKKWVYRSIM